MHHKYIIPMLACLMLTQVLLMSQSKITVTDGPYIERTADGYEASWVEDNMLVTKSFNTIEEETFTPLAFPLTVYEKEKPLGKYEFTGVEKIAAISDIHGQYDVMIKLFESNDIIDDQHNWSFGNGHLVITGDIFDRGDQVTQILWFVYGLEQQALQAGGRVHFVLGNHEVMVMTGDDRFVHKNYRYTMAVLKRTYQDLFNEHSVLGHWLRTKPISVSINDIAFLHAGFSKSILDTGIKVKDMNEIFSDNLIGTPSHEILQDSMVLNLFYDNGPLWYRGYVDFENFTKKDAKQILKKIKRDHIVVGHTSMKSIVSLFEERIFMIDSSIKFGKTGEVLLWENGTFSRGTLLGETISIETLKPPEE